jgi:S-methylmethionine-dependent homocysteine/selenocysteine methylase
VFTSLILDPEHGDRLLGGDLFSAAFAKLRTLEVGGQRIAAFLVNCSPRESVLQALAHMRAAGEDRPLGAYPNLGAVDAVLGWKREPGTTSHDFAEWALRARQAGATLVGGCCGTTPEDIAAIRQMLTPRD